jgi:hypothetical protein
MQVPLRLFLQQFEKAKRRPCGNNWEQDPSKDNERELAADTRIFLSAGDLSTHKLCRGGRGFLVTTHVFFLDLIINEEEN